MDKLKDIIKQSIDLHYHIGPEIIPRKNIVQSLFKELEGKIAGIALKNHFYPTSPLIQEFNKKIKLIGSVVLNNTVGGLNPQAIYAASVISKNPIIVWLPTIDAQNFLSKSRYQIPREWVQKKSFKAKESKNIKGINIMDDSGNLTKLTIEVLREIKKDRAILATGHISWQEAKKVGEYAVKIGIKKIIITHPIYQKINMPVNVLKYLANVGCYIESCYSMYSIDKISIKKIASQIKEIGYKSFILSSDMGQEFSPDPDVALKKFSKLLLKEGVSVEMIYQMLVTNPNRVINV